MLLSAMVGLEGMEGYAFRDVVVLLRRPSLYAVVCYCRLGRYGGLGIRGRGSRHMQEILFKFVHETH